jgi:PAS domain-containing protein
MHSLLRRQVLRLFGNFKDVPPELDQFLADVDDAYRQFDSDRAMLERSLELSSNELLQANADMRAVFEVLPDLFFRIDSTGKILDCQAGTKTDFLIPPKTMIGKRIQDIPVSGVGAEFIRAIELVHRDREMTSFEYSLFTKGVSRHYEARFLPLLENEIITIIRDIAVRKRAEQASA